jgi:N,N'-diacetyllegionaminate synthase
MQSLNNIKTFIIAEAGINHNGKFHLAKKLIIDAKKAGADAIKFQIFQTEKLVSKNLNTTNYQFLNSRYRKQYNLLKKLELSQKQHILLKNLCKKKKITYLCSAFDLQSLKFLKKLNLKFYKVPSGELDNIPYLKLVASFKQKVLLSSGLSDFSGLKRTVIFLKKFGLKKNNLVIMHCNTDYPTKLTDVNLNCISSLGNFFKVPIGYSDHTKGTEVAIAAVAMGATIIEKHFTLNKNMNGPDHSSSLEFNEFKKMVDSIRNIDLAKGKNSKILTVSAKKNLRFLKKYMFASKNINKGEKFSEHNLEFLRASPSFQAIPIINWMKIINRKAKRFIKKEKIISYADVI